MIRRPPRSTRTDTLFPYTTLFRSAAERIAVRVARDAVARSSDLDARCRSRRRPVDQPLVQRADRRAGHEVMLRRAVAGPGARADRAGLVGFTRRRGWHLFALTGEAILSDVGRAEERRVGQECVSSRRSRWSHRL